MPVYAGSVVVNQTARGEDLSEETEEAQPQSARKLTESNRFERIYKTGKTIGEDIVPVHAEEKMYNWTLVSIFF